MLAASPLSMKVVTGGVPASEWRSWQAILATGMQRLVEHTGEQARWEEFRAALLEELQRPDLFSYCTLILVRGTVPADWAAAERPSWHPPERSLSSGEGPDHRGST